MSKVLRWYSSARLHSTWARCSEYPVDGLPKVELEVKKSKSLWQSSIGSSSRIPESQPIVEFKDHGAAQAPFYTWAKGTQPSENLLAHKIADGLAMAGSLFFCSERSKCHVSASAIYDTKVTYWFSSWCLPIPSQLVTCQNIFSLKSLGDLVTTRPSYWLFSCC